MEQCKAERTKSWPTLPRKKKMECLNVLNDVAISATDALVIYSVGIYLQTKKDGPVRTSCKRTCNKSRESGRFVHWLDTKITSQTRSIVRCWKKLHHDERSIGGTQFQGSEITFNFFVKQIFNSYWKSKLKKEPYQFDDFQRAHWSADPVKFQARAYFAHIGTKASIAKAVCVYKDWFLHRWFWNSSTFLCHVYF